MERSATARRNEDDFTEEPTTRLRLCTESFLLLESAGLRPDALYHQVLASVHQLCATILDCESAGVPRDEIVEVLEPVRSIHGRSGFVSRLQQWPRGYPGDFETVEAICGGRTSPPAGRLEEVCETYALTRPIAQQHRNKVQHQAARIMKTLLAHPGTARVFSVACGSCPDLRSIAGHLPAMMGELWLNDGDPDALDFSARALSPIAGRCRTRPGNALKAVRRAVNERPASFDLVLAGGLFDYLSDRQVEYLVEHAWSLVAPGGVLFFTNIASGNPYRPLIEYLGDWFLIERSEDDVRRLCHSAGIPGDAVTIAREETGLALLVEAVKQPL